MLNFDKLKEEHHRISQELALPDVIKDREKYQQLTRRFSFLEKIINLENLRLENIQEKKHLEELAADPKEDEAIRKLAKEELIQLEEKIKSLAARITLKIKFLPVVNPNGMLSLKYVLLPEAKSQHYLPQLCLKCIRNMPKEIIGNLKYLTLTPLTSAVLKK